MGIKENKVLLLFSPFFETANNKHFLYKFLPSKQTSERNKIKYSPEKQ
jgi:hypothetical protein